MRTTTRTRRRRGRETTRTRTTTRTTTTRTRTTSRGRRRSAVADGEDEDDDAGRTRSPRRPIRAPARRYRFKHPTASGKTVAAAGLRRGLPHVGVLILTHRRLLVDQFMRDLKEQGYGPRLIARSRRASALPRSPPVTVETYAWFIKHAADIHPDAYGVVICDEAHTALGERTAATIRRFSRPTYIGMTATDQLLQKHVGDVFPAEVADFPLADAVRRGVVAPLRALRVKPGATACASPGRRRRLRPARAGRGARPRGAQHGRRDALPRPLRPPRGHRLRGGRRPRRARRGGDARDRPRGRAPSPAARRRARWRRRSRPTSAATSTCSSTPSCWPRAGTRRARRSACTWRRPPAAASTSSASAASCACTAARRPGVVVDFVDRPRRTPSARSRSTACSTSTSTSRAASSRPSRRGAASAGGARRGPSCATRSG